MNKNYILGIDTSNYKTSIAVIDKRYEVICDLRKLLGVKQGERGLQQSTALFQHIENLPELLDRAFTQKIDRAQIGAVSVSSVPRQIENSYMPVFKAGEAIASSISTLLSVPLFRFSHQEGHIEAVKRNSVFKESPSFLCFHLSGGTSEILNVHIGLNQASSRELILGTSFSGFEVDIIGGTLDISFGQVLDRLGVAMGLSFPSGEELDHMAIIAKNEIESGALSLDDHTNILKAISIRGNFINLSGIDTQVTRGISNYISRKERLLLVREVFEKIGNCLVRLIENAVRESGINDVLFAGGVSASEYLRIYLEKYFSKSDINIVFGTPEMSSDNAIGIALLGGKTLWR